MNKLVIYPTVFLLLITSLCNAQYTKLLDFDLPTNGGYPRGSLFSDGTFLYGMTQNGGANNIGTLFKLMPDGTGYSNLIDFSGTLNGNSPFGDIYSDGIFLYGMTYQGGSTNYGVIFKIMPDGTGFTKLLDFVGSANGRIPHGSLISDGTFLYGMTQLGGTTGLGVLFKILPDGTGYSKLLEFSGTTNGSNPYGNLYFDGTFLYGMNLAGGTSGKGTIFKIKPDGTGYIKLLDFFGAANGDNPQGSLISDGTFLYGMSYKGGTHNKGVLFKIMPDGTEFTKLINFSGTANGSFPCGSLIFDGTFLYGMTSSGGTFNMGVIFKILPDGTGYSKLLDFSGTTNGSNPYGSLISDGTFLYGMTYKGGSANVGTVFKYCIPFTYTQFLTICYGESVTVGSNTYIMSGTYTDTLTAVNTCDSIVTTNLTVLPANLFSQSPTVCSGQYVTVGSNTYTISGTYTDTLTAFNTCDSIVTTNLTVLPTNTFSQSTTICDGQSLTVGSNTYTLNGIYTDTLPSYQGCDSVVTTNLTVLPANTFSQSTTICEGQSITVGSNTYTIAGTYTDTLIAMNGCDSIITTNLTVDSLPSVSLVLNPDTVCVNTETYPLTGGSPSGGSYSGVGVSAGDFNPSIAGVGLHNIIYTYSDTNNCIDNATSQIVVDVCTGISSVVDNGIFVFPNPNNGSFTIKHNLKDENYLIEIVDLMGKVVHREILKSRNQQEIKTQLLNTGIYFVNVKSETGELIYSTKMSVMK